MANGQIDPFGTIAICSVMTRTALDPKRKFRAATTIDSGRCEGLFRANGARLSLPWRQKQSFWTRVSALLSHRTLHKQYRKRDHKRQHSRHPKGVEICQRRRLLLTQVFELLHSQLLGGGWIAVLLNEESLSPREKAAGGCVERIKKLAKP